jgi:periplasmic protein TonB
MRRHVDVLDQQDSLKRPFYASVGLHAAIFVSLAILAVARIGVHEPWGDPNAFGGGAVGITPVKSIPLPGRSGPKNPVANDTESQVPAPPKPQAKPAVKDDADAIPLKSKRTRTKDRQDRYATSKMPERQYPDNTVYSRGGQAATSPLFSEAPGSGGVGVGTGAPFGARFGGYAGLIRDRVAQKWRTDQVDARLRELPAAIVTFEIQRNGQVRNIRVIQSSGNPALDYSAQRAVTEAAPFEPLPSAYDGSSATIEFWFQLKR